MRVSAPIRSLALSIGVFLALYPTNGLAQAAQAPAPPLPNSAATVDKVVPIDAQQWRFQVPVRLPDADVIIEVVAPLPVAAHVTEVTRRLGRRHNEVLGKNGYLTTIAELIMLVEPQPANPPRRHWKNISLLTVSFDEKAKTVTVEYCIDKCKPNKKTGMPHPKRKMVSYSAPEPEVLTRLEKRLAELKQYSDR